MEFLTDAKCIDQKVKHIITVGARSVMLTEQEAAIVSRGEISRPFARKLEKLGIVLPPRGCVLYHHEIRIAPGKVIKTEARMRRLPYWERPAKRSVAA